MFGMELTGANIMSCYCCLLICASDTALISADQDSRTYYGGRTKIIFVESNQPLQLSCRMQEYNTNCIWWFINLTEENRIAIFNSVAPLSKYHSNLDADTKLNVSFDHTSCDMFIPAIREVDEGIYECWEYEENKNEFNGTNTNIRTRSKHRVVIGSGPVCTPSDMPTEALQEGDTLNIQCTLNHSGKFHPVMHWGIINGQSAPINLQSTLYNEKTTRTDSSLKTTITFNMTSELTGKKFKCWIESSVRDNIAQHSDSSWCSIAFHIQGTGPRSTVHWSNSSGERVWIDKKFQIFLPIAIVLPLWGILLIGIALVRMLCRPGSANANNTPLEVELEAGKSSSSERYVVPTTTNPPTSTHHESSYAILNKDFDESHIYATVSDVIRYKAKPRSRCCL